MRGNVPFYACLRDFRGIAELTPRDESRIYLESVRRKNDINNRSFFCSDLTDRFTMPFTHLVPVDEYKKAPSPKDTQFRLNYHQTEEIYTPSFFTRHSFSTIQDV